MNIRLLVLFAAFLCLGCMEEAQHVEATASVAEATSLLGEPLYAPVFSGERKARLDSNLVVARTAYDADPTDANAIIWLGRRLGYLWRYQEAIDVFAEGLEQHPDDARLYRHRGHRYITVRDFDRAVADLSHAASLIEGTEDEVELDGQPNAAGIPTSTLHTNIYYHLGLAHYLKGDFEAARAAYDACLAASGNNDMRVATADWLYMTLRRLGRDDDAAAVLEPIHADMEILENTSYHRRLLMYKGEATPASLLEVEAGDDADLTFATQGYGVGNWYLYNGQQAQAEETFRRVLDSGYWAAFGYIAAEADLHRLTNP